MCQQQRRTLLGPQECLFRDLLLLWIWAWISIFSKWKGKKKMKEQQKLNPSLSELSRKQGMKKGSNKSIIIALYIYTWKNHRTASQKFYLLIQMKPDSSVKTWRLINTPRSIPKSITESSQYCSSAESFLCSHSCTASHLMDHTSIEIDCLFLFRKHLLFH